MPHALQNSLQTALYVVVGVVLFWLGLRWFEKINLYFPSRTMAARPGDFGLKYEDLYLDTTDGVRINAWYVEDKPESPVILFSHGNAGNISHRMEKLLIFRKAGASVLIYDYRGYGRSSGSPSEQGTYHDAEAAYTWLKEKKGVPPERIILYGESLGCGVAMETALKHPSGGLILESGFTSTVDMGKLILPFLPVDKIVRFRYDNMEKVGKIRTPLLVMHSPEDDIVPFAMGEKVFAAAPEPKTFFAMKGDHNEGFLTTGPAYGEAIAKFLSGLK